MLPSFSYQKVVNFKVFTYNAQDLEHTQMLDTMSDAAHAWAATGGTLCWRDTMSSEYEKEKKKIRGIVLGHTHPHFTQRIKKKN